MYINIREKFKHAIFYRKIYSLRQTSNVTMKHEKKHEKKAKFQRRQDEFLDWILIIDFIH